MADQGLIEAFKQALVEGSAKGQKYTTSISVSANSVETHNLGDFPIAEGAFVEIRVIATNGTTDTDLSIHEDTGFNKQDMVFRVTTVSVNDAEPTGGHLSNPFGIAWEEASSNSTLHVQTSENSGNAGSVQLEIRYVESE